MHKFENLKNKSSAAEAKIKSILKEHHNSSETMHILELPTANYKGPQKLNVLNEMKEESRHELSEESESGIQELQERISAMMN